MTQPVELTVLSGKDELMKRVKLLVILAATASLIVGFLGGVIIGRDTVSKQPISVSGWDRSDEYVERLDIAMGRNLFKNRRVVLDLASGLLQRKGNAWYVSGFSGVLVNAPSEPEDGVITMDANRKLTLLLPPPEIIDPDRSHSKFPDMGKRPLAPDDIPITVLPATGSLLSRYTG